MEKQKVKWFKVVATPTYDDIPNDDDTQTFYMLSARPETAKAEVKEAMLSRAFEVDEYGAHGVCINYVRAVKNPPAGALYQMVRTSQL